MNYHLIDRKTWTREDYFNHFLHLSTTYSVTVEVNITHLMEELTKRKLKFYPAVIFLLTKAVNKFEQFRMDFIEGETLVCWDKLVPIYTTMAEEGDLFQGNWLTENQLETFDSCYSAYLENRKKHKKNTKMFPQGQPPQNSLSLSLLPWFSFSGFNLNIGNNNQPHLLPIITGGKITEKNGQKFLPLSVQVHHAVCDGYHVHLFLEEVERLIDHAEQWIDLTI